MSRKEKTKKATGLIFVGCMFVGMGIGYLFGQFMAGMYIGMGLGFITMAIVKVNDDRIREPLEE